MLSGGQAAQVLTVDPAYNSDLVVAAITVAAVALFLAIVAIIYSYITARRFEILVKQQSLYKPSNEEVNNNSVNMQFPSTPTRFTGSIRSTRCKS